MAEFSFTDWGRTGATIVSVTVAAVSVVRWTQAVDDRLGGIETKLNAQVVQAENAATAAKASAEQAARAADGATQAVAAVKKTQEQTAQMAADTHDTQEKMVRETRQNRAAVEQQSRSVRDLKTEMRTQLESLVWRVRQLEESSRRVEDAQPPKGKH